METSQNKVQRQRGGRVGFFNLIALATAVGHSKRPRLLCARAFYVRRRVCAPPLVFGAVPRYVKINFKVLKYLFFHVTAASPDPLKT